MKCVIITGVSGKLGEAYLNYFVKQPNTQCFAFTRRINIKFLKGITYLYADLLDKDKVYGEMMKIPLNQYSEIIFIHPIGMFKFEKNKSLKLDKDHDGIDDEVFASNVNTFVNIFEFLKNVIKKNKKIKLTLCTFGSITDRYNIPFWESYTKSKNILRRIIHNFVSKKRDIRIRGVFVNVSTADTGNERNLRPYADRTYWLAPSEIVNASIDSLLNGRDK